ncbi:MerR family transcriptional regulator [Gordonia amarae]|uniref:MerR family transcriptional regulator n=2 Tax=Gordonia amarae TaxID=36821 RepID=A0A857LN29_9ACTN|nr:MerR family transcriptional regulator [Gordonia amarae]MCS3879549.1 DNA-binding transcriptional MerR regulator [Gordonia amarae]QHN18013.1 MerR family transcriptional regulator [Gordonia amarae]QHN22533.1 MerR family transcriptional regulator [Gordonia amarae]QHN31398.1 MerR family transcriptional regulator [Gordonia amarae]QHN40144.1 MerR family transcriptional regulator [Gordonia amarae]
MADGRDLQIGEVAELVGVSTRTIRHYHHAGVVPEPPRSSGGYRQYGLVDVVHLLRVRRLVHLGLSLAAVKDALADRPDGDGDMAEILQELRDGLADEEARLAARRKAVEELLARPDGLLQSASHQHALTRLRQTRPVGHPGLDREAITGELVEAAVGHEQSESLWQTYELIAEDSDLSSQLAVLSEGFEGLAEASADDPGVDELVEFAARLGDAVRALLPRDIMDGDGDPASAHHLLDALAVEMSPAQERCLRLAFARWAKQS